MPSIITENSTDLFIEMFDKQSDYTKLQKVIAYFLRFVCVLCVDELQNSTPFIVKIIHRRFFYSEIVCQKNNQTLASKQLRTLNPFIDKNDILRVGGRHFNAEIPFAQKFPILLPSKCHMVDIFLRKEHIRLYHAEPQTVLSNFRLTFWAWMVLGQSKYYFQVCDLLPFSSQRFAPNYGKFAL